MIDLPFHEVAALFPLMEGEPFEQLKADIKAHGQRLPVWTWQGKIIDGRNRYRACVGLGIEPKLQEWDGKGSLVAFVWSLNGPRRHLDKGQLATIGAEMLPLLEAEAKERQKAGGKKKVPQLFGEPSGNGKHGGEAAAQAAKIVGTNPQYVRDAKKLKAEDPESFEKVKAGRVKLGETKRKAAAQVHRARTYRNLDEETKAILGDHAVTGREAEMQKLYFIHPTRERPKDRQQAAQFLVDGKAATVAEAKRMLRPADEVSEDAYNRIHNLLPRLTETDRQLLFSSTDNTVKEHEKLRAEIRELLSENLKLKARQKDLEFDSFLRNLGDPLLTRWFKELSKKYHPDRGGSHEVMAALVEARDALLVLLKPTK